MNNKQKISLKSIVMVVCLAIVSSSLVGCEPLRKKFTRKKKEARKDEVIPILDPIDYPDRYHSAEERYKGYYSMWQVWHRDLMDAVDDDDSDKRQKYLISKSITQLEEMSRWIGGERYSQLRDLIDGYVKIQEEVGKPRAMRSRNNIKRKLMQMEKAIRENFKPKEVGDFLK